MMFNADSYKVARQLGQAVLNRQLSYLIIFVTARCNLLCKHCFYTEEIQKRAVYVFGPFLEKHGYSFPESWQNTTIPYTSKILFELLGVVRRINQKLKKKIKRKSIAGSIYGDMQREH